MMHEEFPGQPFHVAVTRVTIDTEGPDDDFLHQTSQKSQRKKPLQVKMVFKSNLQGNKLFFTMGCLGWLTKALHP